MAKSRAGYIEVRFEGKKHRLPALSPGRKAGKRAQKDIAKLVCEMYATDRYPLDECLRTCGIKSRATWWKWTRENKQIEQLYREAQETKAENYRHSVTERARTTLERYLDGQVQTLTERTGEITTDAEGNEVVRVTQVKEKQIYIKPSIRAAEIILTNFDGHQFAKNPDQHKGVDEEIPTDIKVTIKGGEMPPITNEEDINDSPQRINRD